ncbi:hypothetical protein LOD99_283 [Oopsacas minuta]|uniref:Uncharacterized protein n=1 Tax=Oopsacas minuta TaxID=111878 RepID=A0AAV7K8K7_9METZ|nr:hypothetical protein LOD99_283 [Oopsacas minuta]
MDIHTPIPGSETDTLLLPPADEIGEVSDSDISQLDTSYLSQRYTDEGYQTSCIDSSSTDPITIEQNWDFFQEEYLKHECVVRLFTAVSIIAYTVRRAECNL